MDSLGLLHPSSILSLAGIGVAAGFVAGLLGIGGGVLIVPLLLTVLRAHGVDPRVVMHLTVGTSLGVVLANSIAGTLTHRAAGNVASRGLPALALASVAGAFAGARAAAAVAGQDLQRVFGGFMLLVAARFLLGRGGRAEAADAGAPVTSAPLLGGIGALGGFVSAFFGVGGGVVAVPLLAGPARFPIHRAIGTSAAMIVFSATAGLATHVVEGLGVPNLPRGALGYFHPVAWALIASTSALAARAGARAAARTRPERLRRAFGLLLAIVGARMLFFR